MKESEFLEQCAADYTGTELCADEQCKSWCGAMWAEIQNCAAKLKDKVGIAAKYGRDMCANWFSAAKNKNKCVAANAKIQPEPTPVEPTPQPTPSPSYSFKMPKWGWYTAAGAGAVLTAVIVGCCVCKCRKRKGRTGEEQMSSTRAPQNEQNASENNQNRERTTANEVQREITAKSGRTSARVCNLCCYSSKKAKKDIEMGTISNGNENYV